MKTIKATTLLALLALTACNKDQFDQNKYQGSVDTQFMIDYADPDHDWCLTKSDTITIRTPETSIYSVQILTDNPYTSATAEIAAEGITYVWDDYSAEMAFTVPVTQHTLYVAALDQSGNYIGVMPFTYGTDEVEVKRADLLQNGTLTWPGYQKFTYLYESTFPQPDDFDYNDMVLRISKSLPNLANSNDVDLTVTLDACGAGELYAAAIQLAGIPYSAISKVEIVGGKAMDEGYPIDPMFITNKSTLQRGHNGNAVIRLFECAQYALARNTDEWGDIAVIRYNTAPSDRENYSATVKPVTLTYRITFNSRDVARLFTFDRIDPFLIHEYNMGYWEVHTYPHKFDLVISDMDTNVRAYDNHISWSLVIPKGDFRYPIEGMPLSTFNADVDATFGPYDGFADWMKSHLTNRSWYLSVTRPQMVYQPKQ